MEGGTDSGLAYRYDAERMATMQRGARSLLYIGHCKIKKPLYQVSPHLLFMLSCCLTPRVPPSLFWGNYGAADTSGAEQMPAPPIL